MSRRIQYTILLLSLVAVLGVCGAALAQSGNGYDLTWWTVDGGGDTVSSGVYRLSGTVGQPELGVVLSGGAFTLYSGFWAGGMHMNQYAVYLPLVLRNAP